MKIAIIGGGASGLMCAYSIKKSLKEKADVTIFERLDRLGKKIIATGNGKCNLSNENLTIDCYNDPRIHDAISKITPEYIKKMFFDLGIITYSDKEGRIYPYSLSSKSVIDAFLKAIDELNIKVMLDTKVNSIRKDKNWVLETDSNNKYQADVIVIASGSIANTKYNDIFAKSVTSFGMRWVSERAALCPIRTKEDTKHLNGIHIKAKARVNDKSFDGEVLFKNDGISGIASFDISRYIEKGDIIHLDLMKDYEKEDIDKVITNFDVIRLSFPKMIALDIIKRSDNNLEKAKRIIKDYTFTCKELYGFDNAQIMQGGVSLNDVNCLTFASSKVDNLYIIGEALDVDGKCGGYNLHFAWTSGILASLDIIEKYEDSSSK